MTQLSLRGIGVLVTRPAHQAEPLIALLEAAGARVILFPTLQITPIPLTPALLMARIEAADIITFISANAVYYAQQLLTDNDWVAAKQIAAVGKRTALALNDIGWSADILPDKHFNSESLLACHQMQEVVDQRILIIRGEGGRETLASTLRERGADVDYAEVYRREIPDADIELLLEVWRQGEIHVTTITSNSALENLMTMLGDDARRFIQQMPLAVFSQRQAYLARQVGCEADIIVATNATNEAMVEATRLALLPSDQVIH